MHVAGMTVCMPMIVIVMVVIASRAVHMSVVSVLMRSHFRHLAQQGRRVERRDFRCQGEALAFQPMRQFSVAGHEQVVGMGLHMHMHLA